MRRPLTAFLVICLLLVATAPAVVAQSPSPPPSPEVAVPDFDPFFPTADEVGAVLGQTVEAMGVMADMSQLWEGTDIDPDALLAKRLQRYRSLMGEIPGAADDSFASVTVDIDWFRSADDAARYGGEVASRVSDPLAGFPTELSAEMVATGSWASDEGFGGSTIVARAGPVVVIVTAARTGATEMETATEGVTRLVLDRLLAGCLPVGDGCALVEGPTPSRQEGSQRVEVPEAGFAITFPASWEVSIDTSDLRGEGGSFAVVSGRDPASDSTCEIYLYGPCTGTPFGDCAAALDEVAARMVAYFDGDGSSSRTDASTTMDLPAGYAVRVDTEWIDEGVFGSLYLLTDGSVHDTLRCRGSERPDDRWLSIAESFEFLPEDE
jgi:hypothetical protein